MSVFDKVAPNIISLCLQCGKKDTVASCKGAEQVHAKIGHYLFNHYHVHMLYFSIYI